MLSDQPTRRSAEFRRVMSSIPVSVGITGGALAGQGDYLLGGIFIAAALAVDLYNYAVWWKP